MAQVSEHMDQRDMKDGVLSPTISERPTRLSEESSASNRVMKRSSIVAVLVSGIALFSDGYTVSIIGYMEPIFKQLYGDSLSDGMATRLSNSFLVGEILGMLAFGMLIDRGGRKAGVVGATGLLVLGIVLATAAHGVTVNGMFWMMIVGRGIAGFGAGGEYPTCATSATEAADSTEAVQKRRGILVAMSTLFAVDLGFVISGVVAIIVLLCYHDAPTDGTWRICSGIVLVAKLPISIFFFRYRMVTSTQYRKHAIKQRIPYLLALKLYWKPMLGSTMAWFCYDFISYPFGLFSSTIVSRFNPSNSLIQNIGYGTVINCFYLPGGILGGILMDKIGRRQTMTLGFVCVAIIGFVIGGAIYPLLHLFPLLVVLYGLFNAASEMGPGVATFLCATESFPTPLRGHFVGLAAAIGKLGAVIGTQVFNPIIKSYSSEQKGQQTVFLIASGFALAGALASWTLLPDKSRKLEDEDSRFRRELQARGYNLNCLGGETDSNPDLWAYNSNGRRLNELVALSQHRG